MQVITVQSDAMINCVAWSPDDRHITVASDSNITLWDSSVGHTPGIVAQVPLMATLAAHAGPVSWCGFQQHSDSVLVSVSHDCSMKEWDCSEENRRSNVDRFGTLDGHPHKVTRACYDSTGCYLASASGNAIFSVVSDSLKDLD